jgi:CBS domain-containing protein
MLAEGIEGLPVVDEKNHCLGIITLGYLLRGFVPEYLPELSEVMIQEVESVNVQAFFGSTSILFLVADFFKEDVDFLSGEASLMTAAWEMERQMLPMLPVVARSRLIGVLSRRDIMNAFFLSSSPPSQPE